MGCQYEQATRISYRPVTTDKLPLGNLRPGGTRGDADADQTRGGAVFDGHRGVLRPAPRPVAVHAHPVRATAPAGAPTTWASASRTRSSRCSARPGCCAGRYPAWPTSSRCGASSSWSRSTSRPTARCSTPTSTSRSSAAGTSWASCRTSSPLAVLAGIITFAIIRLRSEPKEYGRASRFYGSHTGGAWLILFMIFMVIFTLCALPRRRRQHRQLPLRQRRVLLARDGQAAGAAGRCTPTSGSRPSRCCRTSASCWSSCSSCCTPSTCTSSWRRST